MEVYHTISEQIPDAYEAFMKMPEGHRRGWYKVLYYATTLLKKTAREQAEVAKKEMNDGKQNTGKPECVICREACVVDVIRCVSNCKNSYFHTRCLHK